LFKSFFPRIMYSLFENWSDWVSFNSVLHIGQTFCFLNNHIFIHFVQKICCRLNNNTIHYSQESYLVDSLHKSDTIQIRYI
jgi:hypothetical protein